MFVRFKTRYMSRYEFDRTKAAFAAVTDMDHSFIDKTENRYLKRDAPLHSGGAGADLTELEFKFFPLVVFVPKLPSILILYVRGDWRSGLRCEF